MFNDYRHTLQTSDYGPIAANFGPGTLQKYQSGFGQTPVMPGMDTRRYYRQGNYGSSYPTNTQPQGGFGFTPPWFNFPANPPIDVQGVGGQSTSQGTQTGVQGASGEVNMVATAVDGTSNGTAVIKSLKGGTNITLSGGGSEVTISQDSGTALDGSDTININSSDGVVSGKYTHTSAGSPFLNLAVGDAGIEVNFGVGLLVEAPGPHKSDSSGSTTLDQRYKIKIIAGSRASDHNIGDVVYVNNMFSATVSSSAPGGGIERYVGGIPIDDADFNTDFDNYPHISGEWEGANPSTGTSIIDLDNKDLTNLTNKQCVIYWHDKDNVMGNSDHASRPYYTMIPEGNYFGKCTS